MNLRAPEMKLNESLSKLPKAERDSVRMFVVGMVRRIADRTIFKSSVGRFLNEQQIGWTDADLDELADNVNKEDIKAQVASTPEIKETAHNWINDGWDWGTSDFNNCCNLKADIRRPEYRRGVTDPKVISAIMAELEVLERAAFEKLR